MEEKQSGASRRTVLKTTMAATGVVGLSGLASAASLAVSTSDPISVSHCSAAFWGSLDDVGGASSVDVTFEWREDGASSWNTTRTETLEQTASVRHYVDGLSSGTTYEYRLTADASDGDTATASTVSFTTDSSATLKGTTKAATDVEGDNVELVGSIDELGGASSADVYFRWGEPAPSGDFPANTTTQTTISSGGEFSDEITGLDLDSTYEYWFVVDAGTNFHRSERLSVTTGDDTVVELWNPTGARNTDTSYTLNVDLTDLGNASSADVYMQWRKKGASTWNTTPTETFTSTGTYEEKVTGLEEETTYEVRGLADASDGDSEVTDSNTFTTTGDPEVETRRVDDITSSSAELNGEVMDLGGADSVDGWFEWGKAGEGLPNATNKVDVQPDSFFMYWFAIDVSGLESNTEYEYRAHCEASDGETDTGTVETFTTT